jgi:hypothetical protein
MNSDQKFSSSFCVSGIRIEFRIEQLKVVDGSLIRKVRSAQPCVTSAGTAYYFFFL